MYLSEIYAAGFRCFPGDAPLSLQLQRGLNILIGPNDAGKTAIIDAPRYVLWTRGDDYVRLEATDFYAKADGTRAGELLLRCTFEGLSPDEEARFLEWCTNESGKLRLHLCLRGTRRQLPGGGASVFSQYRAGKDADGMPLEGELREYLRSTYLRPLRDAERELRPGRRSRLSRILGAVTARNVWRNFNATEVDLSLRVRRLLRDQILLGAAAWETAAWNVFCEQLRALLSLGEPNQEASAYTAFNDEGAAEVAQQDKANQQVVADGQLIHLGSIHSVKGRTVDAMMVVETEVFRGMGADQRTMDLATVLPHAFGVEERDFSSRPIDLAAATNVFVGITRPRHFLALAMRKSVATAELIAAATAQGWKVRDLTAST
jgi:hypothetical protein